MGIRNRLNQVMYYRLPRTAPSSASTLTEPPTSSAAEAPPSRTVGADLPPVMLGALGLITTSETERRGPARAALSSTSALRSLRAMVRARSRVHKRSLRLDGAVSRISWWFYWGDLSSDAQF